MGFRSFKLSLLAAGLSFALGGCGFFPYQKKEVFEIKVNPEGVTVGPLFMFIHGTFCTEQHMEHYRKPEFNLMMGAENRAFNLPIADKILLVPSLKGDVGRLGGAWTLRFNPFKMSFAQDSELQRVNEVCSQVAQPLVLVGVSLGATSILNYAGLYKNPYLQALVVEAPFDHISSVVHSVFSPKMFSKKSVNKLFGMLTGGRFKADGPHAEDLVKEIALDMPILLIHSKKDQLIPLSSSEHLYQILRKTGHKNTHLLVLEKGGHGLYQNEYYGSPEVYQATVHAFYKQYGLPYDKTLAEHGAQFFAQCQPLVE